MSTRLLAGELGNMRRLLSLAGHPASSSAVVQPLRRAVAGSSVAAPPLPAATGCAGCSAASSSRVFPSQSLDSGRSRWQPLEARRHYSTPRRQPPPLLLVLDLDETLIRVSCDGVHRNRHLEKVDFRIAVDVGKPPKTQTFDCGVALRPGLNKFMEWIKDRRKSGLLDETWIFTTSTREYTQALLLTLDPKEEVFSFQRVLCREKCTPSRLPGFYLKDLTRVPSQDTCEMRAASRKVLVDNSPISCVLNRDSSILVRDWLGNDTADIELQRVQDVVDQLLFDARLDGEGNYAEAFARSNPSHERWRERLQDLQEKLAAAAPQDPTQLRELMKAAQHGANDIKKELFGTI